MIRKSFKSFFSSFNKNSMLFPFSIGGNDVSSDFTAQNKQVEGYSSNVIAYRCIKKIAKAIASINLGVLIGKEIIYDHPVLDFLEKPNPMQSRREFFEDIVSQILITGNAYVQADYDGSNSEKNLSFNKANPTFLWSLNPKHMSIMGGYNKIPSKYIYDNGVEKKEWLVTIMGQSNILHLKEFSPSDDYLGLSPMTPAGINIDQVNEGNVWNYSVLKNSGKRSGVITIDKNVSWGTDKLDDLKNRLQESYSGGRNAGKDMVLSPGMDYKELSMSASDMDFIEGLKMSMQMTAFSFGVPYDLVNTDQAKYENLEKANELFWVDAVQPLLIYILDELSYWLGPRFGKNISFWYDESKIDAIANKMATKRNSLENVSFMTINEKRQSVGLDPVEGGDQILSEFNKVPLENVGFSLQEDSGDSVADKSRYVSGLIKNGYDNKQAQKIASIVYDDH